MCPIDVQSLWRLPQLVVNGQQELFSRGRRIFEKLTDVLLKQQANPQDSLGARNSPRKHSSTGLEETRISTAGCLLVARKFNRCGGQYRALFLSERGSTASSAALAEGVPATVPDKLRRAWVSMAVYLLVSVGLGGLGVGAAQAGHLRITPLPSCCGLGNSYESFGNAFSTTDNAVFIGAFRRSGREWLQGSVYELSSNTFELVAEFENPLPVTNSRFGRSVSSDEAYLLVGAPGAGAAYLFDRQSRALVQTLAPPQPSSLSFGQEVYLAGKYAIIADVYRAHAFESSHFQVFDVGSGEFVRTLSIPVDSWVHSFPSAVSDSDLLVSNGMDEVYRLSPRTGELIGKITLERDFARPITALSAAGSRVLVVRGGDAWEATLFDAVSGQQLHRFSAPTSHLGAVRISMSTNHVLIGQYYDEVGTPSPPQADHGVAYLFDLNSGALLQKMENPNPDRWNDHYADALAISQHHIFVGAMFDNSVAEDAGAVYAYRLATPAIEGDVDGDLDVDLADLNLVRNHFGARGPIVMGDTVPLDGVVDLRDLNAVRNHFGAVAVAEPSTAVLGLLCPSIVVVGVWLRASRRVRCESCSAVAAG